MITIFGNFWQFLAKKFAVFTKTNVVIKFLNNLANFFADFFRRKYLKNHNIGPWLDLTTHLLPRKDYTTR
jgi:hypothetical protein